jgi:hypothetical protein
MTKYNKLSNYKPSFEKRGNVRWIIREVIFEQFSMTYFSFTVNNSMRDRTMFRCIDRMICDAPINKLPISDEDESYARPKRD